MKVGVVGTGMVGSTGAYSLVMARAAREIVLVDMDTRRALAESEDIGHAVPFAGSATVRSGGYADLANADVVIIAAGVAQRPGETRLRLLERNATVFADVIGQVLAVAPDTILLIASNPVDIMTEIAVRLSGLPSGRVIGSGTILDTARFRWLLAEHFEISAQSIHAYVIGEHGDSEVLCWSGAMAGSVSVTSLAAQIRNPLTGPVKAKIDEGVRRAAYRIISGKGATWFGIGAGLARIVRAIGADERRLLTVSSITDSIEGVRPVALSLPRIVGRAGIVDTLMPDLDQNEQAALYDSATILAEATEELRLNGG